MKNNITKPLLYLVIMELFLYSVSPAAVSLTFNLNEVNPEAIIPSDIFYIDSFERIPRLPLSAEYNIDLSYSTLLGCSAEDRGYKIVIDDEGCAYITGQTYDGVTDFPTTPGAINETHNGGRDVFVCKISADGTTILYSTLLGGSLDDYAFAIVIDDEGCAYITGQTYDGVTDFPTTPGAINETHNGGRDVFVCKISADGTTLLYSTLLGGGLDDMAKSIAIDDEGCAYITGYSTNHTTNFPSTPGAINETHNGNSDVFLCKINADGTELLYSTFLGGLGSEIARTIVIDDEGCAYITGDTFDVINGFPTTPGAINESHNGISDVFVCKISADGTTLLYSTFLGGSGSDSGYAIAIDADKSMYVTGYTSDDTTDFPTTPDVINETHNDEKDLFVCKISPDGTSLLYSTLLGGSDNDEGYAIAIDDERCVYITGHTYDYITDFPITPDAFDQTHNGNYDAFICKINADGTDLLYSTLLGGSYSDSGEAIAIDIEDNIYVVGYTFDDVTDFPTTPDAINETHNGNSDVFVCKITLKIDNNTEDSIGWYIGIGIVVIIAILGVVVVIRKNK